METITNTHSGERLSFFKLFKEKKYRVLIPIIQRDYAQGRKSTKNNEIRGNFLTALYQYLDDNKANRDLDFVYGSLSEVENQTDFIPLDGQQRLTTLFLLHWYLYQQEDKTSQNCFDFKHALLKENKSMFTYETRTSSSDFCNALISNEIDFAHLLPIDDKKGITMENQLSKTIENSAWYFLSWNQDPTIKSMLTMLDSIHNKFAGKKEFFDRLLNLENPIITFQFLNLKEFKLTDDLYIKMNSRGKPLTSFENFKAKFEQYLEKLELSTSRTFPLLFNGTNQNVSLKKYFSHNIDTKWANLFWNYKELIGNKNIYDEELKNFIRVIFTNQYATTVPIGKVGNTDRTDDTFEFLLGTAPAKKREDYTDDISFFKYDELKALSENSVLYLIDALNSLENGNNKIKPYLSADYTFYFDEKITFDNALKYDFSSNQERIMFHAYVRFLIHNQTDRSGIVQWMRVIHNLAYNTVIDGAVEIARAIKSIEKMLPNSNEVLNYIINNEIDGFASWQILEEKIKACLILKSTGNNWKSIIEDAEKHSLFDGQIGFILEFAEIVEYFKTNKNCNWAKDKDYFECFVNYSEKAIAGFKYRNSDAYKNFNTSEFLFERAVMTKGLCAVKSSQNSITSENRLNLLHSNVIGNNIARDYSWKRLLRIDGTYSNEIANLKKLFDDNRFNKEDVENSIKTFLSDKTNSWRDYFINNSELMRFCTKGFIKVDSEYKIYLLLSIYQGANQYFAEMYTYYLWKEYIENETFQNMFLEKNYNWSKSYDELPSISLINNYNQLDYKIDIIWYSDKKEYGLYFYKLQDTNKIESDYLQEKQDTLINSLNFDWNSDESRYQIYIKDAESVKIKIIEICNAFK